LSGRWDEKEETRIDVASCEGCGRLIERSRLDSDVWVHKNHSLHMTCNNPRPAKIGNDIL